LSRLVAHRFNLHETVILVTENEEPIPSITGRYNRLVTNSHDHSPYLVTVFVNPIANENCVVQGTFPSFCLVGMATTQEQYVCKSCREIDFRPLLKSLKPGSCYPEVEFCSTYDKDCAVCVLLYEPLPSRSLISRVWSYPIDGTYHVNKSIPGVEKSVVIRSNCHRKHQVFGVSTGGDFSYTVNEKWDPAIAQSWLQTCLQSHGPACTKRLSEVVDMALIDCDSMAIVEADGSSPWIALSYVWATDISLPQRRACD
jgi:hypothetical protein